ncbi:MAG: dimethylsulfonioproprionate lyase family protein [Actinomycetota bacterium]
MTADYSLVTAFDAYARTAPERPGVVAAIDALSGALRTSPRPVAGQCDWSESFAGLLQSHADDKTAAGRFAAAIGAVADELTWLIPYLEHGEPDLIHLHRHYRYAAIAGPYPSARFHCDRAALFVSIQGADVDYTQHVHKAPELYGVLGGSGGWQLGDGPHETRTSGEWIWHPTGARHAMRTTDEAMTAMAIWTDDLESLPVIVRQ